MNVDAPPREKDLIGHLLLNPDAYYDIAEELFPRHFQSELMGAIYEAIGNLRKAGSSFGLSLVEAQCKAEPGGITLSAYLAVLMRRDTTGMTAEDLAEKILDPWYRRQLVDVAAKLPAVANDPSTPYDGIQERAVKMIDDAFGGEALGGIATTAELADRLLGKMTAPSEEPKPQGISTGFRSLDDLICPLMPGRLIVVAGATSMGKSALVQLIAWMVAIQGIPVHFFTNEMDKDEAMERFVAQMARVDTRRLVLGTLNAAERERVVDAAYRLKPVPLLVDDLEGLSASAVRMRVQRTMRQQGTQLAIVDHLQFLEPMTKKAKEYEQVSETTRELKKMAKALNIPVILVSHVNRGADYDVKTAKDIRLPQLRDLHGSSSIEKDADTVLFVHRPIYYLNRSRPTEDARHFQEWKIDEDKWDGRAELIKAKMRGGVGFAIRRVAYTDMCALFEEETATHHDPTQATFQYSDRGPPQ